MRAEVRQAVASALGQELVDIRSLSGGDINDAYRVRLADSRTVFVKTRADADPRMFACEARGLRWLADAEALRVPEVLAVSDADSPGPHFLALQYLAPGAPGRGYSEALGRGLAELHLASPEVGAGADAGLDHDNFIATLTQDNRPMADWSAFYGQRRLLPLAVRAIERALAPESWRPRFERLVERLPELTGPPEPPARLHGDLWSGNVHSDERGQPCLIDPAVYAGHREIDLAMLALFGGLDRRTLDAYNERYALAPGHPERQLLYQLYPLLVHVNLFGGSYVRSVERALTRYLG